MAQPHDLAAIDREIKLAVKLWKTPGVAVAIVSADRVVWMQGYGVGDVSKQKAVTSETLFPVASCTKAFTSTLLAVLVSEGKLNWDDPVRKHLPDFRLSDPNADALVSVRDLLCHRTGMGGHDLLWYRAPWSQSESIRRIGKLPLDGPFRATFAYQSIMYMAAGAISGKHHREGWAGLLRDRLLQPLEMQAHATTSGAHKTGKLATGHRLDATGKPVVDPGYFMADANPAGSVYASARDLSKWLQFHLNDGLVKGKPLVKAETLQETRRPHTVIPPGDITRAINPDSIQLTYAMGWIVQDYRGVKVLAHGGWIDGFRCQVTLLPDQKLGLVVLANLDGTRLPLALSYRLVDILLGGGDRDWNAYFGELVEAAKKSKERERERRDAIRRPDHGPTLPVSAYTGDYHHPAYGKCTVHVKQGKLIWEWSSFEEPLLHLHGNTFEIRNESLEDSLADFTCRDGKVVSLQILDKVFGKK